jgi:hypothetical protein
MSEQNDDSTPTKDKVPTTNSASTTIFGSAFASVTFGSILSNTCQSSFLDQESAPEKEDNRTTSQSSSDSDSESNSDSESESPKAKRAKGSVIVPVLDTVATGEEEEETLLQFRCKLFVMPLSKPESSNWKERGIGILRLNQNQDTLACRLVMRAEGTLKLLLNAFVNSTLDPTLVQERNIRMAIPYDQFMQSHDGSEHKASPCLLLLRFKNGSESNTMLRRLRELLSSPK